MADAYDGEALTVGSSATGPTAGKLDPDALQAAVAAYGTVETSSIRLRYDGTDPTSSVGHLVAAGSAFRVEGNGNVRSLRMIRDVSAGSDAVVFLTYEG